MKIYSLKRVVNGRLKEQGLFLEEKDAVKAKEYLDSFCNGTVDIRETEIHKTYEEWRKYET